MTILKRGAFTVCAIEMMWALVNTTAVAAQTQTPIAGSPASQFGELVFRIDAQPLEAALREFATQANIQLIYKTTDVNPNIKSSGIVGAFLPDVALSRLLAHTNLGYKFINNRTVSILSAIRPRASVGMKSAGAEAQFATSEPEDLPEDLPNVTDKKLMIADVSAEHGVRSETRLKDLDEVVVSAQKREQNVLDVPLSIVVVGSDELQQREISSLEDLASAVPDLAYAKAGNSYVFEIRGISNIVGPSPAVGMYIDEAAVTAVNGGAQVNPVTYDLERVEVLRGPQGTLYGEGSVGGTVRFITKSPNLNQFAVDSEVAALFTEGGDPSQRINAVVNVPLIDNQLGIRVAGTFEHDGGWINEPAADERHVNGQDLTNVRVKALWQPISDFSVSAMAILNRNDRGMDYSDVGSPSTYTQIFNLSTTPRLRSDYELYSLTATYGFSSAAQIVNTVSFLSSSAPMWENGNQAFQLTPPGNPPYQYYIPYQNLTSRLLTDELRLTSVGSGRWQWTVGAFYRHLQGNNDYPFFYFGLQSPPGTPLPASGGATAGNSLFKSWSAFGDASYQLSDRFTVGAGARYFQDTQDSDDLVALTRQTGRFHSTDPRVYAQFKLTPGVNLYTSAAKGFRSGGSNGPSAPTFNPESVWTYELGSKMSVWESRVRLDTAVFWSNYNDYQIFGIDPTNGHSLTFNGGKARIKGIESSLTWQLLPKWSLGASGDYLDGKFIENNAEGSAYAVGDTIDLVPRYQFTLTGQHDFSWLGKPGLVRLDYSQQGPESYRNRYINGPGGPSPWFHSESDIIRLLGFHASLHLNDDLRVGFFAQNLLNDQGFTSPYWYIGQGIRSRPRTFGIEFSTNFD